MHTEEKEIVVHYDEIALKGDNRIFFEKKLMKNLREQMKSIGIPVQTKRSWGRIFIRGFWNKEDETKIREKLSLTPGISNFGFVFRIEKSMEAILSLAKNIVNGIGKSTFRITAHRSDKSFPLNSREIELNLGTELFKHNENLNVNLKKYEKEIIIKVLTDEILIFFKEKGIGGLPVSSSGKAVSLISAGFDSPVASFLIAKRGVKVFPVHFHAEPAVGKEATQAVEDLSKRLAYIQGKTTLALIPVLPIQKYIAKHAPEKLRIILIRRSFMRMANRYANLIGALALVTGESVGQVASQTLENLRSIDDSSELPVLRPLSGMNKNEIIHIARKIGTADISARPCDDTCSLFLPDHPETKSKLEEVKEVERELAELSHLEHDAFEQLIVRLF